jgi:hypothetical protein
MALTNITLQIPEFLVNGYFWSGVGAATLFWVLLICVVFYFYVYY